jgi:hypothetical protein
MRKSEPYTLCINILLKEAFHPEEFYPFNLQSPARDETATHSPKPSEDLEGMTKPDF